MKIIPLPTTHLDNVCPFCDGAVTEDDVHDDNDLLADCPHCYKQLIVEYNDDEYECECCGSWVEKEGDGSEFRLRAERTTADRQYIDQMNSK